MSTTVSRAPDPFLIRGAADPPAPSLPLTWCEECGYDLRGLPPARPCPECGHVPSGARPVLRPDLQWKRSVAVGLVLLLGVTLYATCSVLVQPFSDDLGGTLPALNVPGPKLWAIPLLQRPIGRAPQWPGVVGTRTALLSLLAVWLITAPRPDESRATEASRPTDESRATHASRGTDDARPTGPGGDGFFRPGRLLARWGSVLPFGVAFGILLTTQGLWPAELPSYRMLLVTLVELPAAALLYAHLHRLARRVPGRDRRRAFELLRWAVPATIAAGVVLMGMGWLLAQARGPYPPPAEVVGPRLLLFAAYGAAAVSCGMIATAAVGSLAATYAAAAFFRPAPTLPARLRDAARRARRLAPADTTRLHYAAVASGMVLLLGVTVLATDEAPWAATREFPSGNLPFFSFAGPRLAAATPVLGRRSNWDPLVSRMTLVALNLAAVWLITRRPPATAPAAGRPDRLRPFTRWASVFATGAALATAAAWESMEGRGGPYLRSGLRPEFFALAIVLCQTPPTAMLYACLARIASSEAKARPLAARFKLLAIAIPALVLASFLIFVAFRKVLLPQDGPAMMAFCGVAGAVQLAVAVWSAAAVATLAATLVRARVLRPGGHDTPEPIFRNIGSDTGAAAVVAPT